MIRNYLDVCLELPWGTYTKERVNVDAVRRALDRDHFGMEKVKERILESIAVRQMNPEGMGRSSALWALRAWARPRLLCLLPRH